MSLNRIILIGRATKDPELRYLPNGTATATFTLAVDRPFTNGNGNKETDFINIVVWKQLAETVANYLKKGRLNAVEGRLQIRRWESENGTRYITEVVADNVRFLGGNSSQGDPNEREPYQSSNQDPFRDDGKPIDISDDDLPF
ncbi:single-stranded DNA-binding protein [Paenibacillus sp. ACRRY]|uniref:single-stranded DNA-binding protein n=1 Tax=Paenibacillus sp. ACRRY TaxID=2918208 RepID=UPI001EF4471B|nr:single-stranded DNA-binding protein [Paenibacillus sp. ACRRY]MCG7385062.1 single-stranded DNA-binding protein [Paenibacillus sp. ACRRY]